MCNPDDLGRPLPDTDHATSVALPLWDHVVGYEEGRPDILEAMALGYPRFVVHPMVGRLFKECERRFAAASEASYAFPSRRAAEACSAFMADKGTVGVSVHEFGYAGIHAMVFPRESEEFAKAYWQHFGQIISSRLAAAALQQRVTEGGEGAREAIRAQLASLSGCGIEAVSLYPSGMAAMMHALQLAQRLRPGTKSVQLGFPYVDVLKCQTVWGPGAHFLPHDDQFSLDALEALLEKEDIAALVCEIPGNPLLQGPDLKALSALLQPRGVPLIVDDTLATIVNVDALRHADMVVTSLTKTYSGTGDVMAGSVLLKSDSELYSSLMAEHRLCAEDLLWDEDARALAANAVNFVERTHQINASTLQLVDFLRGHPAVERVYYPKYEMGAAYDNLRKPDGGYGGLFSLLLRGAENTAPPFYDALQISKGPSLGINFSIACPYTLLAHYKELDWAASHGVSPYLIRVSIGLEAPEDLQDRFARALEASGMAASVHP